jgi:hypothetical protein
MAASSLAKVGVHHARGHKRWDRDEPDAVDGPETLSFAETQGPSVPVEHRFGTGTLPALQADSSPAAMQP